MTKSAVLMLVSLFFLFIIISNVSAHCPFPTLDVSLTPDFLNDASFQNREVNYSEVFPPQFNCSALLSDLRLPTGIDVYLEFNTSFKDLSGKIYSSHETKLCKNRILCINSYYESFTKNIPPESIISCNVRYLAPVGVPGEGEELCLLNIPIHSEDNIKMPSFDLYIKDIKAMNVVEDVDLVVNKPLAIRVWPVFDSNLITKMDKEVSYKFEYSFPENILLYSNSTKIKPIKNFDLEEIKQKVIEKAENPDEKDMDILIKTKRGEESVNYLQLPVPANKGDIKINSDIDYLQEYVESNNNYDRGNDKEKKINVVNSRKIKILPVHVILDEREIEYMNHGSLLITLVGPVRKSYTLIGTRSDSTDISNKIIEKQLDKNLIFLEKFYPLIRSNIEVLDIQTIHVSIDLNEKNIDDPSFDYRYSINEDKIIRELEKKAKEQGVDYAVGFVYYEALSSPETDREGFSGTDSFLEYVTDNGQNSALFLQGPYIPQQITINDVDNLQYASAVMVHELAHLNYIGAYYNSADYSDDNLVFENEYGRLSSNGWILNQTDGTSNTESGGPQVNVWETEVEKIIKESRASDRYSDKPNTLVCGPRAGNLILDILTRKGSIFITKEQYEKLLENYKEKT